MDARKRIVACILSCLLVLFIAGTPVLAVFFTGAVLPAQYGETWYGALSGLYHRMEQVKGPKIVVLGNSNVAFGLDSALAERLLREAGLEYSVCGFGLYGSLGTRMMLELAASTVEAGDLLVLAPEWNEQALSMYFSPREAWYALDGDIALYFALSRESQSALAGGYPAYASEKLSRWRTGETPQGSGVYASSSFDGHGDLTCFPRPHNVMGEGFDPNDVLSLDASLLTEEFVAYLNDYAADMEEKGVRLCWSYSPINRAAVPGDAPEASREVDRALAEALDFPVISALEDYLMESGWFYDSNCHLNEAGMVVRTVQLVNDLKNELGCTAKTDMVLPEMPVIPQPGLEGEGDNSCAGYFTYRQEGNYYVVTGLTEEGAAQTELTIPYQVDGLYVSSFLPEVFAGNRVIKSVTVQENIRTLPDGCFAGCMSLEKLILRHSEPAGIAVGYGLAEGLGARFRIYVPEEARSAFANNYFWSIYGTRINGY